MISGAQECGTFQGKADLGGAGDGSRGKRFSLTLVLILTFFYRNLMFSLEHSCPKSRLFPSLPCTQELLCDPVVVNRAHPEKRPAAPGIVP